MMTTVRMRRISTLAAATALGLLLSIGACQEEALSAPAVKHDSGDLAERINSFVDSIPKAGSEGYDVPTSSERKTMAAAFNAIEAGKLSRAASLAGPLKYDVVKYEDTSTGRMYVMLTERHNADGSWPHAWGMYVFSPGATSDTTIEVAHPVADWNTEDVGAEVFREADAEDLFVAGAHRDANAGGSADMAHASKSVFQAIHKAAIEPATKVFQPHGFSQADHPDYGEAVVSAGTAPPTQLAQNVHSDLRNAGFDARLYDGVSYSDLGATTNVQGISTRAIGADFVHVETIKPIRDDATRRSLFSSTVAGALNDVPTAYDDMVLADNPVAYFRLDGHNVKDLSSKSHDGRYVGAR